MLNIIFCMLLIIVKLSWFYHTLFSHSIDCWIYVGSSLINGHICSSIFFLSHPFGYFDYTRSYREKYVFFIVLFYGLTYIYLFFCNFFFCTYLWIIEYQKAIWNRRILYAKYTSSCSFLIIIAELAVYKAFFQQRIYTREYLGFVVFIRLE